MTLALVIVLAGLGAGQIGEHLRISGQVRDDQVQLVAGAEVAALELHGDDYYTPKSARLLDVIRTTDPEGRFAFDVWVEPRRDVMVVARKTGLALGWDYIQREHPLHAEPGTTVNSSIELLPPKEIAGRLLDTEGKAVVGANIQALAHQRNGAKKDVYAPREWLSVKTDTQGHFAFNNLPIDATVKFVVEVPHSDIAYTYPPGNFEGNAAGGYRVDWEDVDLTLPPAATVQGRVVDKATEQGIRGIRLMLYPENPSKCEWRFRPYELFSGTNGLFEVEGVPPGEHILHMVSGSTDWVGKNVPINFDGLDQTISTRVRIEKGMPLQVMVRDRTTGHVLPDITVWMDDRQNDQQNDVFVQSVKTDAMGKAHLHVPRGKFKIHAWGDNHHDGLKGRGVKLNMTGPRSTPVEISVVPQLPLVRGRVVDTQGQPAENAVVIVGLGQTVLTDKQGRFEAMQNALYPSHLVVVRDIKRDLVGASFFYDALRELRVVLKPSSRIKGRVTDNRGRGIAGADVTLQLNCKRPGRVRDIHGTVHLPGTRTDSEGYYRLDTVMPLSGAFAEHYHISYGAAEYGSARHKLEERMEPGQELKIPDMKLVSLDGSISGVVLDENSNPVANKLVSVGSSAGGASDGGVTSTDEQGRFEFNRIPQGPVTLGAGFASDPDRASVYAHSGDHVTIRLGDHFKNYVAPGSLVGNPLPDLRGLEIGFDYERIRNKKTLVVFVDYAKGASRVTIGLLKRFRLELRRSNVEVVCIQVSPVDEDDLKAWKKENKISFPIHVLPGHSGWEDIDYAPILKQTPENKKTLRQQWGIRSLPWTILADENQKIMATGMNIQHVLSLVHEERRLSPLRNNPRRRR
jgi:hypothetical protein